MSLSNEQSGLEIDFDMDAPMCSACLGVEPVVYIKILLTGDDGEYCLDCALDTIAYVVPCEHARKDFDNE